MKKFTDFSKLKVGDYFLSIWKANVGERKRISIVKKINKTYLIRDVWTLFGYLGNTKNDKENHKGWNEKMYNFYKLNEKEIKKYKAKLTLKELEK